MKLNELQQGKITVVLPREMIEKIHAIKSSEGINISRQVEFALLDFWKKKGGLNEKFKRKSKSKTVV